MAPPIIPQNESFTLTLNHSLTPRQLGTPFISTPIPPFSAQLLGGAVCGETVFGAEASMESEGVLAMGIAYSANLSQAELPVTDFALHSVGFYDVAASIHNVYSTSQETFAKRVPFPFPPLAEGLMRGL